MKSQTTTSAKYLIALAGPTGVGKSEVAVTIAKELGCAVFSVDSRQVYREMEIGTAKTTASEMLGVPHFMTDFISIHEGYSAGQYLRDLEEQLTSYFKDHQVAVLTGGTGLYFNAIFNGLNDFPAVDPGIVESLNHRLANEGIESLQAELRAADPQYFKEVDIHNGRRLIRALSIILTTGKKFSTFLATGTQPLPYSSVKMALFRPREELYKRINQRVERMIAAGLVEEVSTLYPYRELQALQTVGYAEIFAYLDHKITLEEAIAQIQQNSRRYAKRQMTWFKNQGEWEFIHADDTDRMLKYIYEAIPTLNETK